VRCASGGVTKAPAMSNGSFVLGSVLILMVATILEMRTP